MPEQLHCLGNARGIGLHDLFEVVDPPLLPTLDSSAIERPDPDKDVDRRDIVLGREHVLRSFDHALGKLGAILERLGVRLTSSEFGTS
ncbi:MAG TPA: hypothetical protein VKT99_02135 [Xanthobacteraceae bacterium]|jgi:hypothetical protein|nr:hypothetical protein [Xanthobacteraceae bacterium]